MFSHTGTKIILPHLSSEDNDPKNENGYKKMSFGKGYQILGWIGLPFFLLAFVGWFASEMLPLSSFDFSNTGKLVQIILVVITFPVLIGMMIYLLLLKNIQVLFNNSEIVYSNIFKRKTKLAWDDITKVSFDKINLQLTLTSDVQKSKIVVHKHMSGFGKFREEMALQVSSSVIEEVNRKIDETKGR